MGAMTLFSVRGFIGADGCDRSATFIRGGTFALFVRAAGAGVEARFSVERDDVGVGNCEVCGQKAFL